MKINIFEKTTGEKAIKPLNGYYAITQELKVIEIDYMSDNIIVYYRDDLYAKIIINLKGGSQ